MKKIFLIIVVLSVTFFACKKKPQAWTDIQGTWDIEQCLINGVDSTTTVKGQCYDKYIIEYFGKDQKNGDKLIHLYNYLGHHDKGILLLEEYDYKRMHICNFNLNQVNLCSKNIFTNECVDWDVNSITTSYFEISTTFKNNTYYVKYKKV